MLFTLRRPLTVPFRLAGKPMIYLSIKILHLLAAMAFVGTLFFQVLILAPASRRLDNAVVTPVSQALGKQARRVIHVVAVLLYGAGISLAWSYRSLLAHPFASHFATLLSLKIMLALLVIGHYAALIVLRNKQLITPRTMHMLNISLLITAVLIVICAKTMFVL